MHNPIQISAIETVIYSFIVKRDTSLDITGIVPEERYCTSVGTACEVPTSSSEDSDIQWWGC